MPQDEGRGSTAVVMLGTRDDASQAFANEVETESCLKTKGEVVAVADVDVEMYSTSYRAAGSVPALLSQFQT